MIIATKKDQNGWLPALVILLLFAFPLAGNSVKSWTGALFFVLAIAGLVFIAKNRPRLWLNRREKVLTLLVTLLFFVWLASGLANGWNELQTKGLGVQVRALFFVPIYFLVRDKPDALKWLTYGCVAAAAVLFYQCYTEIYLSGRERAYGVYDSPGLVAVQSLVFIVCIASYLVREKDSTSRFTRAYLIVGLFLAAAGLILSGSRATYFTVLALSLVLPFFLGSARKAAIGITLSACVLASLYFTVGLVNNQVNRGYDEIATYMNSPNKLTELHGSVGQRLEMWRAAIKIGLDNPIFGVGWRNFPNVAQRYAAEGSVNGSSVGHPHPHNSYLEFLVTAGFPGLIVFVALLFYPLSVALKSAKEFPKESALLITFSTVFALNSITEGGTLIYGNALSFFLVFLAVIFADFIRQSSRSNPRLVRQ